ncbi:hypothetical protein RJ640_015616 [Escallonia rubra]|uniref:Uncharacterized protein n=1 Tax=Escallonia rubra TaxID=112253 RepID=A0AA88UK34_9ASTE|nr:hypothetical protein RJ640_015616 [Escallonia rubra]
MASMGWNWTTLALVVLVYALQSWLKKKKGNGTLPPSPKSLPILGHLHMLGKNPYQDLHKLAEKHGPVTHDLHGWLLECTGSAVGRAGAVLDGRMGARLEELACWMGARALCRMGAGAQCWVGARGSP